MRGGQESVTTMLGDLNAKLQVLTNELEASVGDVREPITQENLRRHAGNIAKRPLQVRESFRGELTMAGSAYVTAKRHFDDVRGDLERCITEVMLQVSGDLWARISRQPLDKARAVFRRIAEGHHRAVDLVNVTKLRFSGVGPAALRGHFETLRARAEVARDLQESFRAALDKTLMRHFEDLSGIAGDEQMRRLAKKSRTYAHFQASLSAIRELRDVEKAGDLEALLRWVTYYIPKMLNENIIGHMPAAVQSLEDLELHFREKWGDFARSVASAATTRFLQKWQAALFKWGHGTRPSRNRLVRAFVKGVTSSGDTWASGLSTTVRPRVDAFTRDLSSLLNASRDSFEREAPQLIAHQHAVRVLERQSDALMLVERPSPSGALCAKGMAPTYTDDLIKGPIARGGFTPSPFFPPEGWAVALPPPTPEGAGPWSSLLVALQPWTTEAASPQGLAALRSKLLRQGVYPHYHLRAGTGAAAFEKDFTVGIDQLLAAQPALYTQWALTVALLKGFATITNAYVDVYIRGRRQPYRVGPSGGIPDAAWSYKLALGPQTPQDPWTFRRLEPRATTRGGAKRGARGAAPGAGGGKKSRSAASAPQGEAV
jgi:hypothetical protein